MRLKNNIAVLDTETIGVMTSPLIHNIGWHAMDREFSTLAEKDYRISEFHFQHPELLEDSKFYVEHRIDPDTPCRRFTNAVRALSNDVKANHIKTIAAYNIPFDYRSIVSTAKFFNVLEDKDIQRILKLDMLDIWRLAKQTVCKEAGYTQFINSIPEGYTANGRMRTTAELVYKYISGNSDFEEAHTALADCQIEAKILKYITLHYKGVPAYYIPKDRKVKE